MRQLKTQTVGLCRTTFFTGKKNNMVDSIKGIKSGKSKLLHIRPKKKKSVLIALLGYTISEGEKSDKKRFSLVWIKNVGYPMSEIRQAFQQLYNE